LHEQFLRHFSHKLNQLQFASIMIDIAKQHYATGDNAGREQAIKLLEDFSGCSTGVRAPQAPTPAAPAAATADIASSDGATKTSDAVPAEGTPADKAKELQLRKRRKLGDEAFVVVQAHAAFLRLAQGKGEMCRTVMKETKPILDALECAPPLVHRAYFNVASEYYAKHGPADSYYRHRLQYVVYTPVDELTDAMRVAYAQDLCLAALVSDKIYNFGEVVALPIFQSLKQSEAHSWLSDLLECFNDGNIKGFNNIFHEYKDEIMQRTALRANTEELKKKITLLCLVELIFQQPAASRNIHFKDIAKATLLGIDQVEWLLMRAMSLGLVKGIIDEVTQTVNVTYIQPRVLDKKQLLNVSNKLKQWSEAVQQTATFMESNTTELFA
jgi:26S proteasome regulatory subunit N9